MLENYMGGKNPVHYVKKVSTILDIPAPYVDIFFL